MFFHPSLFIELLLLLLLLLKIFNKPLSASQCLIIDIARRSWIFCQGKFPENSRPFISFGSWHFVLQELHFARSIVLFSFEALERESMHGDMVWMKPGPWPSLYQNQWAEWDLQPTSAGIQASWCSMRSLRCRLLLAVGEYWPTT